MKYITLRDNEGGKMSGLLPEGWHEVQLSTFMAYQRLVQDKPSGMEALAACATLTTLPSKILNSDVSLVPLILPHLPWLSQLPEPAILTTFQHMGLTYEHVGNLEKVNAGQFEALLCYLQEAQGAPALAAPELLAVLYREKGMPQDAESVRTTAEAFQSLPMSTAWPALAFFLTSSEPFARNILTFSRSREEALKAVRRLETALKNTPSQTLSSRIVALLGRAYISSARTLLRKS